VQVLNLCEGEEAIVESPENAFPPLVVHYAKRSSFQRPSDHIAFGRTGPQKARGAERSKRLSVQVREAGDLLSMDNAGTGFLLLVVAGVLNASFALPMKFTPRWAWENT